MVILVTTQDTLQEIPLPSPLVARIEERLPRTEFDDPGEYATFVLEEVLTQVEESADDEFTSVDRNEVEARLESLGYVD